jgi:NAD(P)-dependent dehydrogenase (short-subunit alcohol dehydrogenase family)
VALVAGAGGGIGRAATLALARAGHPLALLGRTRAALERTAEAARAQGVPVAVVPADAADRTRVEAAVAEASRELGGPPLVLVNSAGVAESSPLLPPDDRLFDATIASNVRAAWVLSTAVLPAMLAARFGRIVHVASDAARRGFRYTAAYVASKHAVLGLVRAMAVDLGDRGVTVHAVCPGFVDTPMTERSVARIREATGRGQDEALAALLATSGQERLTTADEVASVVLSLCGDTPPHPSGSAVDA